MDWPEAVFDAWIGFEHLHGTVEQIYECLDQVERVQNQVNTRRAKEAEKVASQALQATSQSEAASTLISEAVQQASSGHETPQPSVSPMDVDGTATDASRKRKMEKSDGNPEWSKKAKTSK